MRPPANTGMERLGPIDQTRLSAVMRFSSLAACQPAEPVSVSTGKEAALATPMRALAAAMSRSASATSGRRSSALDGMPGGTDGGSVVSGASATENSGAGRPQSTASACSSSARRRSTSSHSASAAFTSAVTRA